MFALRSTMVLRQGAVRALSTAPTTLRHVAHAHTSVAYRHALASSAAHFPPTLGPLFAEPRTSKLMAVPEGARSIHLTPEQHRRRQEGPLGVSVVGDEEEDRAQAIESGTLGAFLLKIYSTTAWSAVGLLATAQALSMTGIAATASTPLLIGGVVGSIGSSMAISSSEPQYIDQGKGLVAVDSTMRKLGLKGLVVSFGMMTAPLFHFVSMTTPMAIPGAFVATTATMGGAAAYALYGNNQNIQAWQPALTGGLFGLLGCGLGSIGASWMGFDGLAAALHSVNTYGGVVLFAGLTAYETKMAEEMHAAGTPDHLQVSAQMFMNFSNLFIRFMSIFSNQE